MCRSFPLLFMCGDSLPQELGIPTTYPPGKKKNTPSSSKYNTQRDLEQPPASHRLPCGAGARTWALHTARHVSDPQCSLPPRDHASLESLGSYRRPCLIFKNLFRRVTEETTEGKDTFIAKQTGNRKFRNAKEKLIKIYLSGKKQ